MIIEIDLQSKQAPYAQIKQSIVEMIGNGSLVQGAKLPAIRQLAGDLGVANNTVARAYRELEADRLVRSNGRRGTIVSGLPEPDTAATAIQREINEVVRRARDLGFDAATVLGHVSNALATD